LNYKFPASFTALTKDFISSLLKIDPSERLGSPALGGLKELKKHPFLESIKFE